MLKQDEAASSAVFNGLPRLQQDTNFIPTEAMKDRELQVRIAPGRRTPHALLGHTHFATTQPHPFAAHASWHVPL